MERRALILACGNPQRGDDGVGSHVADALLAGFCDAETKVHSHQQWLPEMAEAISEADLVIFVDASTELAPGEVSSRALRPAAAKAEAFTHSMRPAGLLELAGQLYGKTPEAAYLVTIGGESFELSEQLSETVRHAVPVAIDHVKAILSGVSVPQAKPHSPKSKA